MSDELRRLASDSSLITRHSSLPSLLRVNPKVPAPARSEARLDRAREHGADDVQPTLVQEMHRELDAREILEQLSRVAPRIDARQWVARAVRVATQALARRKVRARVLLQTRGVLAQTLDRLASQAVREQHARFRFQKPRADPSQHADVDAVVVRVAVVEHDDGAASGPEHAPNLPDGGPRVRRVVQNAVRVNYVERLVGELQTLGIGHAELARQSLKLEAAARERDRRLGHIN